MSLAVDSMKMEQAAESLVAKMARHTGIGGPEMLEVVEETVREPAAGEVRARVLASGVAFADVMCRRGIYPFAPAMPFTPGYDLVGVVDKIGAGGSELSQGQLIGALLPKFGANAEYVCVPEAFCVPVPEGVDPVEAAAVILNYLTAYRLLVDKAQALPGERVLVHSAAGGVGTALLQLGRELGLEMVGTASAGKLAFVEAQGATAVDYQKQAFAAKILDVSGGGVDIVCDPVGGETMVRSYDLLNQNGRLVNFGMLSAANGGKMAALPTLARLAWYMIKPDGKQAMFFGDTPSAAKKDLPWYRSSLAILFDMLAKGQIDPVIGAELPLSQIAKAHTMLEEGKVSGKIVLV